ncbi:S8 family serine peptidase [Deinococcus sp.]|uniref:S8 family serine peptidase n=1 Tax=Deinococcus sp. TaxID=47478 RepID=UPI003C7CE271
MTNRHAMRLLLPVTLSLLAACSSSLPSGLGATDHPGQVAARYDTVVTVPLAAQDTRASLETRSGGTVLSWDNTGCSAQDVGSCQAVLGLNDGGGRLSSQALSTLSSRLGRQLAAEQNRDQFSGGGAITATLSGSMAIWAGGSMAIWAGGSYAPVPQNTAVWKTLHLQQAQTLAPNLGAGVTVAVIDTGLDLNHPAFRGALTDPATWWDFYGGDAVPQDEGVLGSGAYGHGTNVAGIILQVAPRAKIMPLRVLGPDGSGDSLNVASAINWAVAKGANVINLSLGSAQESKLVLDAVKAATARNVLVVSSAGNSNSDKMTYPAANADKNAGLLSVGSVNAVDIKSSFSNYGKALELMSPGENVYAPAPGGMLAAWSGTSQAAPMASGGLALALGQGTTGAASGLVDRLTGSAVAIDSLPLNKPFADKLGEGRLDLAAFLASPASDK